MKKILLAAIGALMALCTAQADERLTGTPIGTSRCIDYNTNRITTTINTPASAFDGSLDTYVATYDKSNTWAGLDLGTPHVITRIGWGTRRDSSAPAHTLLGVFEGSNDPDFLNAVPLYLIDEAGEMGTMRYADVNVSRGFRYVRYVGPHESRCDIAELEFYGHEGEGDDSRFYQITNLPTLSYHTMSGRDPQSKTSEMEASMVLVYDGGTRIQEYPILARCRGNASYGFDKKPYRIRFNDGKSHHMLRGSELESPAKAKKWTLINNYGDKTLMRNLIAFEVSRRMGMNYTPWSQPVDVLVNGEYKGCYQLTDQISVDKDRVNITEMTPDDNEGEALTGGYLIEIDNNAGSEPSKFYSRRGTPVTIKSPDSGSITTAQHNYIESFFNSMEASLWESQLSDEPAAYTKLLDLDSFLRNHLVGEYCGNTDTYHSTYMSLERGTGKLVTGPIWDHDLSFDNDSRTYPTNSHTDWVFRTGGTNAGDMAAFVSRILSDPYAANRIKEIWKEARDAERMTSDALVAYVDSMAQVLMASQRLNFMRWPILGQYVHCNAFALPTYEGEVEMVRKCVRQRIGWMDRMVGLSDPVDPVPVDGEYTISTADDLVAFAQAVSNGATRSKAVMTADIDMSGHNDDFIPIGKQYNMFSGVFDGQGHIISNLHIDSWEQYVGLFGVVGGGVVIRNVILDSSCSISGNAYVGLIGGSNSTGIVRLSCLGNEGTVTAENQNAGGIIGCNMGSQASWVIEDCYVTGAVTGGYESAALSGWVGSNAVVSNCYSLADVTGNDEGKYFYRGEGQFSNCYDVYGKQSITHVSHEKVINGQLCMLLNRGNADGVWHQTLTGDSHPIPSDAALPLFPMGDGYTNGLLMNKPQPDSKWASADIDGHSILLREGLYAYRSSAYTVTNGNVWNVNLVKYLRTFADDQWQGWFIPFEVTVTSTMRKQFSFARFDGIGTDDEGRPYASFTTLSGRAVLDANTPYLIRALQPDADAEQVFSAAIRLLDESRTEQYAFVIDTLTYTLSGTYTQQPFDAATPCYVLDDGQFRLLAEGESLSALRYGIRVSTATAGAPSADDLAATLPIRIDGVDTAIITLDEAPAATDVYDLLGRKVGTISTLHDLDALPAGIYIVGGRKYTVAP